jgi:hypothetical protein
MLQVKNLKDREHHNHKGNIQNIKVFDYQKNYYNTLYKKIEKIITILNRKNKLEKLFHLNREKNFKKKKERHNNIE